MNQKWNLVLTLGDVRLIGKKLGLDLLNPNHHMQVLNSLTDRLAFVFLLCEEQAKEYEVTIEEFEQRLYGEGYANAASNAFLDECTHFFSSLGQKGLAALTERSLKQMMAGQERESEMMASGQIDLILDQAEEALAKELAAILPTSDGSSSPDSQPSPE